VRRSLSNAATLMKPKQMLKPDAQLISRILCEETDERYCFLIKHGIVHWIESETFTIFVELKQIPNTIIVYRRPQERRSNSEKI